MSVTNIEERVVRADEINAGTDDGMRQIVKAALRSAGVGPDDVWMTMSQLGIASGGASRATILRRVESGVILSLRDGKRRRIPVLEGERYLLENMTGAA